MSLKSEVMADRIGDLNLIFKSKLAFFNWLLSLRNCNCKI